MERPRVSAAARGTDQIRTALRWVAVTVAIWSASPVKAEDAVSADCPAAPDPMLTLGYDSRYASDDPTRSDIDEAAQVAADASLRPLDDFLRDLADAADTMDEEAEAEQRAAHAGCILARIADWARADALGALTTSTTQMTIGARLAAFGLVALRARDQAVGRSDDASAISAWLQRRLYEQLTYWETAPDGASSGNLRAWAALAAAVAADLSDDAVLRGWAGWSVIYVACSAGEDGSLPREMARGPRALHYQLHALAPLVTATALLERQGVPILEACGNALDRAVSFALQDLETGARTAEITGAEQTLTSGEDELEGFQLAWLEAYLTLPGDPATKTLAEDWAARFRPMSYSKLGGDQTLIWAPRAQE